MGKSLPPPAAVDLVGSYARRRGTDVELVLSDPKIDLSAGDVVLTLTRGRQAVEARGELIEDIRGPRLVAHAPRNKLRDGQWTLSLKSGSTEAESVDARLLVQGARPLVLLWGAKGQAGKLPERHLRLTGKQRAAAAAGRALDGALSPLPPDLATRIRAQARNLARRALR